MSRKKSLVGKKVRYSDDCLEWYLTDDFVQMCTYPDGRFDEEDYNEALEHVFAQILIPSYYPGVIVEETNRELVSVKFEWRDRPIGCDKRDIKVKR